ncbi:ABC transporter C family member 3-like [Impatiens glandulifera]|uniref:ABC transporter C family member 3-like n=1 Tax=Impatiens glandulifera TaxID=253017 RepID=UPI001FB15635|nr:ABC transporter C family member 3-like [Impatiens glandulifera]
MEIFEVYDGDLQLFLQPSFFYMFFSVSQLILLPTIFVSWIRDHRKQRREIKINSFFMAAIFASLSLSLFNLLSLLYIFFFWSSNDQKTALLNSVLQTLSWLAISAYLYKTTESKFPIVLRIWWVCYFFMSVYALIVGFFFHSVSFWIMTIVSVIMGVFFCYIGLYKQNGSTSILEQEQPLLADQSRKVKVTPYSNANFFSTLTFSWLNPIIELGNKKIIDLDDVPHLDYKNSANTLYSVFKGNLQSLTSWGLTKAMVISVWRELLFTAVLGFLKTSTSYVGPYLISGFVEYLNGIHRSKKDGYILVMIFSSAKLVECLSDRHWSFKMSQLAIRIRACLIAALYKKGLSLSSQSRTGQSIGETINIMSVDAQRIGDFSLYVNDVWLLPLQFAFSFLILYRNLGFACFAAFLASLIMMMVNVPFGILVNNYQKKVMEFKDKRMKSTSEILRNMRILKLQGWEMKFLSKIIGLREDELGFFRKLLYSSTITSTLFTSAPAVVSMVTFGYCILTGIPLDTGKVLSTLATISILQGPINKLPDAISMSIQAKVSLDRIAAFLCLNELKSDVIEVNCNDDDEYALEITNGNFSWDLTSSSSFTLHELNVRIHRGLKVGICGVVGSGKSSFLSCILGEIPLVSGLIRLNGEKSYVGQSPWIQSGTIKENILFGEEMDEEKYDRVVEACCLKKDLDLLPFHDQTVIGERGINLSGGQKQRVQIARALYRDADVYLLDDPFSAVDAHTGTYLFKECLMGILRLKTVIYVTHQIEFLQTADLILVMKDGKIEQAGKYGEILNPGTPFMELVEAHNKSMLIIDSVTINGEDNHSLENNEKEKRTSEITPQGQLVQEEEREKGRVELSVYWKYVTAAYGGALAVIVIMVDVLLQVFSIGSDYWMAWATPKSIDADKPVSSYDLVTVYAWLSGGLALCNVMHCGFLITLGYRTAKLLFDRMHKCVFRAPMSFFDSTPSGRILNRASSDQNALDYSIPYVIGGCFIAIIQLVGCIAVMSQISWQVFIVLIPVTAACIWYQQYYISSARELSRLRGVCKAPLIQHFGESLSGLTTIRSFGKEKIFNEKNFELIDNSSRPAFHNSSATQWLCLRLDMLCTITFAFALVFLLFVPDELVNSAMAGLAVTYGLSLNQSLEWLIWSLCSLENNFISVERIMQYSSIPSEAPLICQQNRPAANWPLLGEVKIHDLQVRYAPQLPLVLRGISCTFDGGKKTGIVGRTGGGKSTLIQSLFRMVEPAKGEIRIDGVDISLIGLHDLRSRLSVIPQDPTMFSGSIRSNLDPLEEFTDEKIWEALDKCQLGDDVRKKEEKLDSLVTENGENWSVGQRQLVCLGRVLLKRSKILVLDEATASVDAATDNLIQTTIREHFSDSTVITIAHRITSILDSDMVVVLDQGLAIEYDSPTRLLENKSSSFAKLANEYASRSGS